MAAAIDAITPSALLVLGLIALVAVGGLIVLDRGRVPLLRFHRRVEPQEPPLWGPAETLVCFGVFLLSPIVAQLLVVPFFSEVSDGAFLLLCSALGAAFSSGFLFHVILGLGQPLSTLGLRSSSRWNIFPLVFTYLFVLMISSFTSSCWLWSLWHVFGLEPQRQEVVELVSRLVREGDSRQLSCLILLGLVVAPIWEELFFRGLLFGWLRRALGVATAGALSAVCFATVHLSLTAFPGLVVLGLALGYVYHRSGSLYVAILLHMLFNGVSFAMLLLRQA